MAAIMVAAAVADDALNQLDGMKNFVNERLCCKQRSLRKLHPMMLVKWP